MAHAFLSYARKDFFFAELLIREMSDRTVDIWRDSTSIIAGSNWQNSIDLGISETAVTIIALSKDSASSHFVTYEWASAIGKQKAIIPILIEDCDVHPRLSALQNVDFRSKSALPWDQLANRIKQAVEDDETPEDADPKTKEQPESVSLDISKEQLERAAGDVINYLDQRGYQRASFERLSKNIAGNRKIWEELIRRMPETFAPALLKGHRPGLKRY